MRLCYSTVTNWAMAIPAAPRPIRTGYRLAAAAGSALAVQDPFHRPTAG